MFTRLPMGVLALCTYGRCVRGQSSVTTQGTSVGQSQAGGPGGKAEVLRGTGRSRMHPHKSCMQGQAPRGAEAFSLEVALLSLAKWLPCIAK